MKNPGKAAIRSITMVVMLSVCMSAIASAENKSNDFQRNALFQPGENQLGREARGFVFIYDGLTDREVELAMDEQPERIEAMMFIRTKSTDANGELLRDPQTGEVVTEEDGCDE